MIWNNFPKTKSIVNFFKIINATGLKNVISDLFLRTNYYVELFNPDLKLENLLYFVLM